MTIISSWNYGVGGAFGSNIDTGAGERLGFSNSAAAVAAFSVDAFNPHTVVTNNTFTTVTAEADNCRYVNATQVSLNEGAAVDLTTANVTQANCTVRIDWEDDTGATVLSNIRFYAFNGAVATVAPTGVTFVAFEHDGTDIQMDSVAGAGLAWNDTSGIGGSGNALVLTDQASATNHQFFIGLSVKPTAYGTHSAIKFRLEFDVA